MVKYAIFIILKSTSFSLLINCVNSSSLMPGILFAKHFREFPPDLVSTDGLFVVSKHKRIGEFPQCDTLEIRCSSSFKIVHKVFKQIWFEQILLFFLFGHSGALMR